VLWLGALGSLGAVILALGVESRQLRHCMPTKSLEGKRLCQCFAKKRAKEHSLKILVMILINKYQ
jgi:hypothetical protein